MKHTRDFPVVSRFARDHRLPYETPSGVVSAASRATTRYRTRRHPASYPRLRPTRLLRTPVLDPVLQHDQRPQWLGIVGASAAVGGEQIGEVRLVEQALRAEAFGIQQAVHFVTQSFV